MDQQRLPFTDPAWRQREQRALPLRIQLMHRLYGRCEGHTCGECGHLVRRRYSRVYYKCAFGPQSHSPATDWRLRWPACGKFEEGEVGS